MKFFCITCFARSFFPFSLLSLFVFVEAFDVLDKSDNEIIDLLEAVRGLPQLCRASHLDRIQGMLLAHPRKKQKKKKIS